MEDREVVKQLIDNGYNYFDYVPCSNLKGIINILHKYYPQDVNCSNNEGESISNAFSALMAGKKPVVLLQNSGLGNLLNPYTSLVKIHNAKIFFVIGYRGANANDEIQHQFMGKITENLLSLMDIKYQVLNKESNLIDFSKDCLLIQNGVIKNTETTITPNNYDLTYENVIDYILNMCDDNFYVFSTTGFISRTLFKLKDRDKNFYNVGAMGCVSAIAKTFNILKQAPTIVLDGDGAFLMRLENNIINEAKIKNKYIYFLLNNGSFNSTGAQKTNIDKLNLEYISKGLGFDDFIEIGKLEDLHKLKRVFNSNKLKIFINCKISNIHDELPRIKFDNINRWITN